MGRFAPVWGRATLQRAPGLRLELRLCVQAGEQSTYGVLFVSLHTCASLTPLADFTHTQLTSRSLRSRSGLPCGTGEGSGRAREASPDKRAKLPHCAPRSGGFIALSASHRLCRGAYPPCSPLPLPAATTLPFRGTLAVSLLATPYTSASWPQSALSGCRPPVGRLHIICRLARCSHAGCVAMRGESARVSRGL